MRLFLCLLLALVWGGAGAATYHVCTTAAGNGTGSSLANCRAGYVGGFSPGAGDTVYVHAGWYSDRLVITNSGSVSAPSVWTFDEGAVVFVSLDVSGNNTQALDTTQTTGSSWALVAGTTDLYRKGTGNFIYTLAVDNTFVPWGAKIYANEADVIATMPAGRWTNFNRTTDGFGKAIYYRGTPTSTMRIGILGTSTTADNILGAILLDRAHDIQLINPQVFGYRPLSDEYGSITMVNSYNILINDGEVSRSKNGVRIMGGHDITVQNMYLHHNYAMGVAIQGSYDLGTGGVINTISAVTTGATTQFTMRETPVVVNGDKVTYLRLGGLTTGTFTTEDLVTNVTGNVITTNRNSSGWTGSSDGSGRMLFQGGVYNIKILNNEIAYNGAEPIFTATALSWGEDSDGLGIGYRGGNVTNVDISGNNFHDNGPQVLQTAAESGVQTVGSGILTGTSFGMVIDGFRATRNTFTHNHRVNLSLGQAKNGFVAGNWFNGTVTFVSYANAKYQAIVGASHSGTGEYIFANNLMNGESGQGGLYMYSDTANMTSRTINNIFKDISVQSGYEGVLTAFRYSSATSAAGVTESNNRFINIQSDALYMAVSTPYTTVAAWQGATSKGALDSVITDASAGWVGGGSSTTINGFKLTPSSPLRRAGTELNVGNYPDIGNRAFSHPPSIGAWEATGGDIATSRTAATARTARTSPTAR